MMNGNFWRVLILNTLALAFLVMLFTSLIRIALILLPIVFVVMLFSYFSRRH